MNCNCILKAIFAAQANSLDPVKVHRNWQNVRKLVLLGWAIMSLPSSLLFCILQFEMNSSDSFTEFKLVHIFLRHRSWAEQRHLCYLSVAREKQFTRFFSAQTKTGILKGFQDWGVYVQKHSLTRRTITRHSLNKGANIVKQTISLFITIISIKHPI